MSNIKEITKLKDAVKALTGKEKFRYLPEKKKATAPTVTKKTKTDQQREGQ